MKKLFVIALITVLALTLLAGCGPKVIKGVDGTKVEVQGDTVTVKGEDGEASITAGDNLPWPEEKMGNLPEFKGSIIGVIDTPQGVSVTMEGVKKATFEAYVAALKDLGYEATMELDNVGGTTSLFQGKNEDDDAVSVQHHSDSDTCVIIYGESLGY